MTAPDEKKSLVNQQLYMRKLRILVAPLDWGLGHATRCIPIIHQLIRRGCEVCIAADGAIENLLREEFPAVTFFPLPGYGVRYAAGRDGSGWKIARQVPRMARMIRYEHQWLDHFLNSEPFDAVISDNRYGLYSTRVPTVFITHQLHIRSPFGRWTEPLLLKWNLKYINRFSQCWIPDEEGAGNLAGGLCHPLPKLKVPAHYIGILSRFKGGLLAERKGHLLVIISGPEPQRSIFENLVLRDIAHYPATATIVRGLPGTSNIIPSTNSIKLYNHLPAGELQTQFEAADFVIARSGYSTVMDVARMNKKAILVPTPGQTEQEYLAYYLVAGRKAYAMRQRDFNLEKGLAEAAAFDYEPIVPVAGIVEHTIDQFLLSLRSADVI